MVYDPGWDMPRINWQPQGSYEVGIIPLTVAPDEAPLVCLPSVNEHWLPLVLGCLDQLRNPSTWLAANDDAMFAVLAKANRLMQMFGSRADCMCTLVRLEDCVLQTSCDNGSTWTDVEGWDENFGDCVRANVPIITPPDNPTDMPHNGLACAIAAYLADNIIKGSMQKAIDTINSDLSLLDFGATVLTLIPEFVLVTVAYDAFAAIYTFISHGTIGDYEDAVADDTLWANVTCAIYEAIASDGYVTPANFPTILANLAAIPYAHSDVISTIVSYVTDLGATGLAQLSQRAGLLVGADCSTCATFCYTWGAGFVDLCSGDWVRYLPDPNCGTCTGDTWNSGSGDGFPCLVVDCTLPAPRTVENFNLDITAVGAYFHIFFYDFLGGTELADITSLPWGGSVPNVGFVRIHMENTDLPITLSQIVIAGLGTNPWGDDNC